MPINSNNEPPHITFPIGKSTGAATITALYDTGGALNTGNIRLHNLIQEKTSTAVATYEEFNGTNPFDPINCVELCQTHLTMMQKSMVFYQLSLDITPLLKQWMGKL